jgi:hypothetical protein
MMMMIIRLAVLLAKMQEMQDLFSKIMGKQKDA